MTKSLFRCLLFIGFTCCITGCAETLIVSAVAPIVSAVAPPTATYAIPTENKRQILTNPSPKVHLLLLEDKRGSTKLIRSTSGFQGLFYHATGWSIDTESPINELITKKIQSHLENTGILVVSIKDENSSIHTLGGEIILFNLDKEGGFSNKWVANVDLQLFLNDTAADKVIERYRVTGTAERTNRRGANSGIDALNEALETALNKLEVKKIQDILKQQ